MSQYTPPTRLEAGFEASSNRWSIPTTSSVDLRLIANYSIAFFVATAIVIDAFRLLSLVFCLVSGEATFDSFAGNSAYGDLVSTPLYLFASILGLVVTAVHRDFNQSHVAGWLVGFAVAVGCLFEELVFHGQAPIPCWGLLSFWFAALCVVTVQDKGDRFSFHHVAFFVVGVFCLSLWGKHGNLDFLQCVDPTWQGLDSGSTQSFGSLDWQDALVAFVGGFVAVVVLPCVFVLLVYGAPSSFGLKVPVVKRREWMFRSLLLLLAGFPIFYLSSANPELQSHYPYVRNFSGPTQLMTFELATLLFYACVEFVFRGYILFGVERFINEGNPNYSKAIGSAFAILVSAVPYIVWHLDKPTPELVGALVWAILAGASAIQYRTVLHLIVIHWLWNVCLDIGVLRNLEIGFTG